jgi:hypothetical protein
MRWRGPRVLRWLPSCAAPGCTALPRLWRRARWRNGKILLDDRPFCGTRCLERAARLRFEAVCSSKLVQLPVRHRIPLGLLMLSRGQLTEQQLRLALEAQLTTGNQRIGEWLQSLGFASERQVTAALGLQWSCPVCTSPAMFGASTAQMLPYRLLEHFRMCPIQYVAATRTLYVSFCDRIDYAALYAIEHMLDCRTEACLVSSRVMNEFLERVGRVRGPGDMLFEGWRAPSDMARITSGQALRFGADRVRIASCGEYVWARIFVGQESTNLLFRRPAEASLGPLGLGDAASPVPAFR